MHCCLLLLATFHMVLEKIHTYFLRYKFTLVFTIKHHKLLLPYISFFFFSSLHFLKNDFKPD